MANRKRRADQRNRVTLDSIISSTRGYLAAGISAAGLAARRFGPWRRGGNAAAWSAGSTLVEVALLAPVLIGLLVGAWDFASVIQEGSRLVSAARAGAQFAIQGETEAGNSAAIATAVRNDAEDEASELIVASSTFCQCTTGGGTVSCASTCAGGDEPRSYVSVDVSRAYHMFFPYPFVENPLTLREVVTMRVQ